jgi:methionyl-tRNA formyltransferase
MPSPVKAWLQEAAPSIPLYQPLKASAEEFVSLVRSLEPDLFVVAAYGEILKTALLSVPRLGPINVHASLLPKWRGAAPIQRSLMAGDTESGVTIMKMVLQMDAGDILEVAKVAVPPEMNHEELQHALALAAKEPLLQAISKLERGTATLTPQDTSQVTFAPKITPEDAIIDWTKPAALIHNQIRALAPQPGAWTLMALDSETKRLKIKRAAVLEGSHPTPKKTHLLTQKEWAIECGENILNLTEVQLEGKKTLPIHDFLRGLHHPPHIL